MPDFRATLFFRNGDAGWSENYFCNAADHDAADDKLVALRTIRLRLSTIDVHCVARRVSSMDAARDGRVEVHDLITDDAHKGTHGKTDEPPQKTNLATDALLIHLTNNWTAFNRIFIRGLPDGVMQSNGQGPEYTAWKPKLLDPATGMFQHLIAQGWLIRRKVLVGGYQLMPITKCVIGHFTTRKVGRPFGLRPGRRGMRPPA